MREERINNQSWQYWMLPSGYLHATTFYEYNHASPQPYLTHSEFASRKDKLLFICQH